MYITTEQDIPVCGTKIGVDDFAYKKDIPMKP